MNYIIINGENQYNLYTELDQTTWTKIRYKNIVNYILRWNYSRIFTQLKMLAIGYIFRILPCFWRQYRRYYRKIHDNSWWLMINIKNTCYSVLLIISGNYFINLKIYILNNYINWFNGNSQITRFDYWDIEKVLETRWDTGEETMRRCKIDNEIRTQCD